MNDKQFTDELFKRMYDLGYKFAEISYCHIYFWKNKKEKLGLFTPRINVDCTCFKVNDQMINIEEYLGIVDWGKVKVDTPILVKDDCDDKWEKAYFAKYEDGMICAWNNGRTSFSARNKDDTFIWDCAKLAYKGRL